MELKGDLVDILEVLDWKMFQCVPFCSFCVSFEEYMLLGQFSLLQDVHQTQIFLAIFNFRVSGSTFIVKITQVICLTDRQLCICAVKLMIGYRFKFSQPTTQLILCVDA